jgi:5'-3' exonuclease
MTIKGLWVCYNKIGYTTVTARSLRGQRVYIDIYGSMYKLRPTSKQIYLSRINPFVTPVDEDEIDIHFIERMLALIIKYTIQGLMVVLVYDGPKDKMKAKELAKRAVQSTKAKAEIKKLKKKYGDMDEYLISSQAKKQYRAYLEKIDVVPHTSKEKIKDFFFNLGFPYVQSLGEAERTCALMNRQLGGYIMSTDGDCFACGGLRVLRNDTKVTNNGLEEHAYELATLDILLNHLDISFETFQDLCIMSGTDFNSNIPNLSWGKALPLLKKYKSIERIGRKTDHDIDSLEYIEVRKRFEIIPWEQTVSANKLDITFNETLEKKTLKQYGLRRKLDDINDAKRRIIKLCSKENSSTDSNTDSSDSAQISLS